MHPCGVTRHEHLGADLCVREAPGDEMGDAPLGFGESGPARLFGRLADPVPERRAAVQYSFTYALGVARRTRGGIGRDRPLERGDEGTAVHLCKQHAEVLRSGSLRPRMEMLCLRPRECGRIGVEQAAGMIGSGRQRLDRRVGRRETGGFGCNLRCALALAERKGTPDEHRRAGRHDDELEAMAGQIFVDGPEHR